MLFSRYMACSRGSTCSPVFIPSPCSLSLIRLPRFFLYFPPSPRFLSNLHAFIFGLRAVYTFACFAYQTQGLCSAFPRSPFQFVRFCLSRIVCVLHVHKHRVCAMLFPRSPLKFVRLCLSLCYAHFASQTSG